MSKKIFLTGSSGNLGQKLLNQKTNFEILAPSSLEVNIFKLNDIETYLKKNKPQYILHAAGLSDPMIQHEKKITESIKKNIIGTANLCIAANKYNIKLIYTSTNFVYPGTKGNYSEKDALLPFNNYGWSKLGGECSVMMLKKHLIIRLCLAKTPYKHKFAFSNYITSFMSDIDVAKLIFNLIDQEGIINIGGKKQSAFNYAIFEGNKVVRKTLKKKNSLKIGSNTSINTVKLKKILKIKK